jgi:hypothetical protein
MGGYGLQAYLGGWRGRSIVSEEEEDDSACSRACQESVDDFGGRR